jgi:hypothetical protein
MKYIVFIPSGFALNEDSSEKVPDGCIEITDEQYTGLAEGTLTVINGEVVNV